MVPFVSVTFLYRFTAVFTNADQFACVVASEAGGHRAGSVPAAVHCESAAQAAVKLNVRSTFIPRSSAPWIARSNHSRSGCPGAAAKLYVCTPPTGALGSMLFHAKPRRIHFAPVAAMPSSSAFASAVPWLQISPF